MKLKSHILILSLAVMIGVSSGGCQYYWKRYVSDKHKFSILVPRFWNVVEGRKGLAVIAQSPLRGKTDTFQENINVGAHEFPKEIDLEVFFDANKNTTLRNIPGAKSDISEGEIYAGRTRGRFLTFSSRSTAFSMRVISAVWVKGKRVYLVTATGAIDDFPRYEDAFKKMMQSLRIRN